MITLVNRWPGPEDEQTCEIVINNISMYVLVPIDLATDSDVLSYLRVSEDRYHETAKERYLSEKTPDVDKVEHPNFIIAWDAVEKKVKLTDRTGTASLSDFGARIATLESKVDALEKP